jgi:hypothetical protein
LILLCLVHVLILVPSAVFLSMSTFLITVGFRPSEQLLGRDFRFAMTVDKAAVRRARNGVKGWDKTGGDQTERGGRRRKGGGKDRLSSSSSEHGRKGSHAHQVPVC